MELPAREHFSRFVEEYGLDNHSIRAFGVLLHQHDSVCIQGVDDRLNASRQISVAALEVRIRGGLESRAKFFLSLDQG